MKLLSEQQNFLVGKMLSCDFESKALVRALLLPFYNGVEQAASSYFFISLEALEACQQ